MNLVQRQIFGNKTDITYNTYIGGISASVSSASLLASKLGISVGAISNFTVVGSDIKCKITGSYVVPVNAFLSETAITYYKDTDGFVSNLGNSAFQNTPNLKLLDFKGIITLTGNYVIRNDFFDRTNKVEVLLENCTSITGAAFYDGLFWDLLLYAPKVTVLGTDTLNNSVFFRVKTGSTLYLNPFLQTSNAGGVEGDAAYAVSQGSTVRYVTNLTAPITPTIASVSTIYDTAIKLIDEGGSINAVDYFEVNVNGVDKGQIKAGGYITGLTPSTNNSITLKAVDMFYNKSVVSSSLSVTTLAGGFPIAGLVSYYKLNSNSNDSYGANNGTDTSVSYVSGKISNAASYNGTSGKTLIGNPANLQLSTMSVSLWVKSTGAGSGYKGLFYKNNAYNLLFNNNVLITYSYGSPAGDKSTGVNISDGNWRHVVMTQQGGVTNGTKIYINGVLVLTTTVGVINQNSNVEFGTYNNSNFGNYQMDELAIYNKILNQTEVDSLYNSGTGITL